MSRLLLIVIVNLVRNIPIIMSKFLWKITYNIFFTTLRHVTERLILR